MGQDDIPWGYHQNYFGIISLRKSTVCCSSCGCGACGSRDMIVMGVVVMCVRAHTECFNQISLVSVE